jgi:hypothetical protein
MQPDPPMIELPPLPRTISQLSGVEYSEDDKSQTKWYQRIESDIHEYARAYATACVLAEREACAERCEQIAAHDLSMQTPRQVAERCAAAIRAR